MPFQTGPATNLDSLFIDLLDFATDLGWTQDAGAGLSQPALHKGDVYVQFRYDGTGVISGAGRSVGIFQSTGYTANQPPGEHPGDSGSGASGASVTDTEIRNDRCIAEMGGGPFTYWFFGLTPLEGVSYIHVVVLVRPNVYRHFGFGELQRFVDWPGGSYAYGQVKSTGANALDTADSCLLDGLHLGLQGATLRINSFPGQPATSVWGVVGGNPAVGSDRDRNVRVPIQGGFRGGPIAESRGNVGPTVAPGSPWLGLYPICAWYIRALPNQAYYLGSMPDVRGIHMLNFQPGQTAVVSAEEWVVFPASTKAGLVPSTTGNIGIAYKKV